MFNGHHTIEHEENVVRIVTYSGETESENGSNFTSYFLKSYCLLTFSNDTLHPCVVSICLQQRVSLCI